MIAEVITQYKIGRIIVEVVQEGEERATYGKQLLQGVANLPTERLGDGCIEKMPQIFHKVINTIITFYFIDWTKPASLQIYSLLDLLLSAKLILRK